MIYERSSKVLSKSIQCQNKYLPGALNFLITGIGIILASITSDSAYCCSNHISVNT